MFSVGADEAEGLVLGTVLDLVDALHRLLVEDIRSRSVHVSVG